MLHQEYTAAPHQQFAQACDVTETTEKQRKLAQLCLDWRLSAPHYKYTRRGSNNVVVGLHCSVIVGEVEYSSPLAGTDWHPGWGTQNDAREAVAGEVLRALGVEAEEEYEEPQPPRRHSQQYSRR